MRDDQEGQLDPSRVLIAADPDGGKLINGAIWSCYRLGYMRRFNLDMRSGQIQRSKIVSDPLSVSNCSP